MKTIIHTAESRGHANHGWLDSYHTFSFANYHNNDRVHFGMLRVLNDDIVSPGMGFGRHPHDNMEIVSIPLRGALSHKDSTGREEIIKTGDVQIMSAGTGLMHSEMNASTTEEVNFLQIWVFPKERNIAPRYEQKTFDKSERINRWQIVVSPDKNEGGVWINQDARFLLASLKMGYNLDYTLTNTEHGIYVFVLEGEVNISGIPLYKRDGMGITEVNSVNFKTIEGCELLVMELPLAN